MTDPRFAKLADVLVNQSLRVAKGEKALLECFETPAEFVAILARTVAEGGGLAHVEIKHNAITRELLLSGSEEQIRSIGEVEKARMEKMQCYVGVRGGSNYAEMSDVPPDKMQMYQTHWLKPVHFDVRVPNTRWVVLRWPTASMAQQADMSTEAFEDFYFRVCTFDYRKLGEAVQPLADRMRNTDRVQIKGPGTDLEFSIKGIGAVPCTGSHNIPDGECFTCPIRDSVNGVISINTPSLNQGTQFSDIRLALKDGRIVEATCADQTEKLNTILDSDEGARYIGEWSLGFNPFVLTPMKDTLFDEKIAGSFHFTPGNAYEEADNGNRSKVHWDMVVIQRPEYGGGEILFDGTLVRKDGEFVVKELEQLNRDNLIRLVSAD